ncbi:MAG: hypothetical protein MZW92_71955 [Comamonadaceae bacterium]|nr:hypothetical protein [Comamonadaceae bacterium]
MLALGFPFALAVVFGHRAAVFFAGIGALVLALGLMLGALHLLWIFAFLGGGGFLGFSLRL